MNNTNLLIETWLYITYYLVCLGLGWGDLRATSGTVKKTGSKSGWIKYGSQGRLRVFGDYVQNIKCGPINAIF
jgi:hypothetical protein